MRVISLIGLQHMQMRGRLHLRFGHFTTDYHCLYNFSCPTYYYVRKSKFNSKTKKAILLGFSIYMKGYIIWRLESKKIIYSGDMSINESSNMRYIR